MDSTHLESNIFSHISLAVGDFAQAKSLYTPMMAALGLELVWDSPEDGGLGYGVKEPEEREWVTLFAKIPGKIMDDKPGIHVAFNAPSRKAVDDFHEIALANGSKSRGEPGLRKDYGDRYYAAFVVDPWGNRLEAVRHRADN